MALNIIIRQEFKNKGIDCIFQKLSNFARNACCYFFFVKNITNLKTIFYGRYTCISTAFFFWSIKNAELILYRLVFVSHILQI